MTTPAKKEPTCPTCGSDDRQRLAGQCWADEMNGIKRFHSWHEYPATDKAEWTTTIDPLKYLCPHFMREGQPDGRCGDCLESDDIRIRTAIRKALDEREAATWIAAAKRLGTFFLPNTSDYKAARYVAAAFIHTAAESRARGNDGD